jgi:hypothetical protein
MKILIVFLTVSMLGSITSVWATESNEATDLTQNSPSISDSDETMDATQNTQLPSDPADEETNLTQNSQLESDSNDTIDSTQNAQLASDSDELTNPDYAHKVEELSGKYSDNHLALANETWILTNSSFDSDGGAVKPGLSIKFITPLSSQN